MQQVGRSKRRRVASELGIWSWWPEERSVISSILSSLPSPAAPAAASRTYSVLTVIKKPTLRSLLPTSKPIDSSQTTEQPPAQQQPHLLLPPINQARNHLHLAAALTTNQRVCATTSSRIATASGIPYPPAQFTPPAGSTASPDGARAVSPAPGTLSTLSTHVACAKSYSRILIDFP